MSGQAGILIGADHSRRVGKTRRFRVRLACLLIAVVAGSQAVQTVAVPPFRVATNLTTGRLAGPTTVVSGRSTQTHQVWWELQDDVTYGIPFLLKEDKRTVACCGLLLLLLTALTYRSLRTRAHRGRYPEKPSLAGDMTAQAADVEEPTEHHDHPAELHH